MVNKTFGFIGGGRITRILLEGLRRAGKLPHQVIVSDTSTTALENLKAEFPTVNVVSDNLAPAAQDIVFLALHPPAINSILGEIQPCLQPNTLFVSLAPKLTIKKLSEGLNGFQRIVRMIPNAPSIIGQGYNPVAFSEGLSAADREELLALLSALGECPEVAEDKLEAYAILTAMGPTYLWFQLYELQSISQSFGLTEQEAQAGLTSMVTGAVKLMCESGLSPQSVTDLIPVKPLGDREDDIKEMYHNKLEPLYTKLKS